MKRQAAKLRGCEPPGLLCLEHRVGVELTVDLGEKDVKGPSAPAVLHHDVADAIRR